MRRCCWLELPGKLACSVMSLRAWQVKSDLNEDRASDRLTLVLITAVELHILPPRLHPLRGFDHHAVAKTSFASLWRWSAVNANFNHLSHAIARLAALFRLPTKQTQLFRDDINKVDALAPANTAQINSVLT